MPNTLDGIALLGWMEKTEAVTWLRETCWSRQIIYSSGATPTAAASLNGAVSLNGAQPGPINDLCCNVCGP
jgi:hypothetical protein